MRLFLLPFLKSRTFARDTHGVTAVEFALVGPIFLGLIGAIIEAALVLLSTQALEQATTVAGRHVMVGAVAKQSTPAAREAYFKDILCKGAGWLLKCSDILYDVRAYTQFSDADLTRPVSGNTFNAAGLPRFQPGSPGQIVVVRSYYKRKIFLDYISSHLGYLSGGYFLVVGTSVFKSES